MTQGGCIAAVCTQPALLLVWSGTGRGVGSPSIWFQILVLASVGREYSIYITFRATPASFCTLHLHTFTYKVQLPLRLTCSQDGCESTRLTPLSLYSPPALFKWDFLFLLSLPPSRLHSLSFAGEEMEFLAQRHS